MRRFALLPAASLLFAACAGDVAPGAVGADEPFTSAVADLYDFTFSGELATSVTSNLTGQIKSQLFYTIGQINGEPGVPQLGKVSLKNIRSRWSGGLLRVSYDAVLPVAWRKDRPAPQTYTLKLPLRVDPTGQQAFFSRYSASCIESSGYSVSLGNFFYHYRPNECAIAESDLSAPAAKVTPSKRQTSGKFPDYHRVWADNRLSVVAVFGKDDKGTTSPSDAGISAYSEFLQAMRRRFPGATTTPAQLPERPGAETPDVVFQLKQPNGSEVEVTALLVDEMQSAGASFDARFNRLTPAADVVLYNGHAGLGANIRSLANRGQYFAGQYQLWFMNGCDTFAYDGVDVITRRRAALNPDDPTGTKYTDAVSNAMPAYFHSLTEGSFALLDALASESSPQSYEQLLSGVDDFQLAVVDGEQDNVFSPTYDPGVTWNGLAGDGTVGYREVKSFVTEELQPGQYSFQLTHDPASPAGDADLRVRVGAAPTGTDSRERALSAFKNTNERTTVTLTRPARIYLTVTGDSSTASRFRLAGWQQSNQ